VKVKFYCDSGANIHSCREEVADISDWGIEDDEWNGMTDDEKWKVAEEWANDSLEIGYEEV